jgi:hypothetical protein
MKLLFPLLGHLLMTSRGLPVLVVFVRSWMNRSQSRINW